MAFHETRLPDDIALRSIGGPRRRTEITEGAGGSEARNSLWANSRRRYDIGYGAKSIDDIHTILAFFEERRGALHGFRFKDRRDFKSCPPQQATAFGDQIIGVGTGALLTFQLKKTYGAAFAPWTRTIQKPVAGTVKIGVNGVNQANGWTVDTVTGIVTFDVAPTNTHVITAGFEFDVPVRFESDELNIDMIAFEAGRAPSIPVIEVPL